MKVVFTERARLVPAPERGDALEQVRSRDDLWVVDNEVLSFPQSQSGIVKVLSNSCGDMVYEAAVNEKNSTNEFKFPWSNAVLRLISKTNQPLDTIALPRLAASEMSRVLFIGLYPLASRSAALSPDTVRLLAQDFRTADSLVDDNGVSIKNKYFAMSNDRTRSMYSWLEKMVNQTACDGGLIQVIR